MRLGLVAMVGDRLGFGAPLGAVPLGTMQDQVGTP